MTILDVSPKLRAVQFTGANSAEVLTVAQGICRAGFQYDHALLDPSSDSSQVIVQFWDYNNSYFDQAVVPVNTYLVVDGSYYTAVGMDTTGILQRYRPYSEVSTLLGANRTFTNNASRSLVTGTGATGFQVSSTRDADVGYNVTTSCTATIAGAASCTVVLEIAPTNSATPGDWVEISRITNSQTLSLAVALQIVQQIGGKLSGKIPAGYYAKLRTITSGTASATYNSGQEVLL